MGVGEGGRTTVLSVDNGDDVMIGVVGGVKEKDDMGNCGEAGPVKARRRTGGEAVWVGRVPGENPGE